MSEATTNTDGTCELVLDYVYGELDEGKKRAFEEHLPTCARCQQEVASFGRVRAAVKRVMPAVEPSTSLGGGALHAQLMHAAAQRKPRRGVLLAFPRKIMQHPALSAAAMFAIVGGAIAFNWSRSKMAMPGADHGAAESAKQDEANAKTVDSPKPTEGTAAATPAAEPMAAYKNKEQNELAAGAKGSGGPSGGEFADKTKTNLALETDTGKYTVQQPVAHHALGTTAPAKPAPARMKSIAVDGKFGARKGKLDDLSAGDEKNALGGVERGVSGGVVGGGGGRASTNGNVKSSAPEEIGRTAVAEKAPARDDDAAQASSSRRGYDAPPPAPSAPMPVAASAPPTTTPSSSDRESGYRAQAQSAQGAPVTVAKPSSVTRNYVGLHKQADEWAKSGRCQDAIKLYQELEKSSQRISPTERVNWIRCLTQDGRQEEAQQRLDELKQEKRVTPAQIQDAEKDMNDQRRRYPEPKKAAKKAAPADRAPAPTTEESRPQSQQQRPAEAPVQAAPPDSTNTKVPSKPAY